MATATTGLSTFKGALEYGGARPSLFDFKITAAPTGVSTNLSDVNYYYLYHFLNLNDESIVYHL